MATNSGETNIPVTDWTTGTLKVYEDDKIDNVERLAMAEARRLNDLHYADVKRLEEAADDLENALNDFKQSVGIRFIEVNEFRKSLDDLGQKMETKSEATVSNKSTSDKIDELSKQIIELRSRLDIGNPAVIALQNAQAASSGFRAGTDITMGKIYAAIGAVGAILAIIVLLANNVFK